MPRWAASTDTNQAALVLALEAIGFSVLLLHRAGEGIHDLAVGYDNRTLLVEVKMPGKRLTPEEKSVHKRFTGAQMVAYHPAEVIEWFRYPMSINGFSWSQFESKLQLATEIYDAEMLKITAPQPKRKYTRKARKTA